MLLNAYYRQFLYSLKEVYPDGEANAIASLVFQHFAQADKKFIISNPEHLLDEAVVIDLEDALKKLKLHTPVQYVLGGTTFFNLQFKVTPDVLIPRPETEELVTAALQFITNSKKKSLLDIGTGSGCIPISIKKNNPQLEVSALEVSVQALQVAKENSLFHQTEINWILVDFLAEKNWDTLPVYDVITSNPPYIPLQEKKMLDKNVTQYEPSLALFVPDDDPLLFYRKIAAFAKNHLADNGKLFMEVHENYAGDVKGLFAGEAFTANVLKDFFEKDRMVTATRFP